MIMMMMMILPDTIESLTYISAADSRRS